MSYDRSAHLTGTDIPAILGVSPWRTAADVAAHKVSGIEPAQRPSAWSIARGAAAETYAASELARLGWNVMRDVSHTARVHDVPVAAQIDILGFRLQGRNATTAIFEVKAYAGNVWERVPEHVAYQAQWQRIVLTAAGRETDADYSDAPIFAVQVCEAGAVIHPITPVMTDAALIGIACQWWRDHVVNGHAVAEAERGRVMEAHELPLPDASDLHELADLHAEYTRVAADADALKARVAEMQETFFARFPDVKTFVADGVRFTRVTTRRGGGVTMDGLRALAALAREVAPGRARDIEAVNTSGETSSAHVRVTRRTSNE